MYRIWTYKMRKVIAKLDKKHDRSRVLGIDPSTHSIDFTLVEDGKPTKWGSIDFYRKGDIYSKLAMVHPLMDIVIEHCGMPTYAIVEESILVRSPGTFRMLSYMGGALMTDLMNRGIDTCDVGVMVHKKFHGYQVITRGQKLGRTAKEVERMKKQQIQDRLAIAFPDFMYQNDDVADSASIALWGAGVSLADVAFV